MQQYTTLFQILLALYCLAGLALLNAPLKAAALFLFMRASLSLAAFMKTPSFIGGAFFVPAMIVLFAQTVIALIVGKARFHINRVFGTYVLFLILVGAISAGFVAAGRDLNVNIEEFTKYAFPITIYILVYIGVKQESDLSKMTRYLAIASFIPIVTGIIEFILDTGYTYEGFEFVSGFRPSGTIIDPNLYGIYLSLCLFLALPSVLRQNRTNKSMWYVLMVLFTIIVARNRGTWIALLIAFAITVPLFRKYLNVNRWLVGAVVILTLASPIVIARFDELYSYDKWGQQQDTASGRLDYAKALLERAAENPLFGTGTGGYNIGLYIEKGIALAPHNDYIRVAIQYGFPATLIYILFLLSQLKWTLKHRDDRLWSYQFASTACQVYILVISLAQNVLTDMTGYGLIFAMMALSHRAAAFSALPPPSPARNPQAA